MAVTKAWDRGGFEAKLLGKQGRPKVGRNMFRRPALHYGAVRCIPGTC